jgi:asparagine synthase (glutamine-hydrolysing)
MCGIVALVVRGTDADAGARSVAAALRTLAARGPDGQRTLSLVGAATTTTLGFSRLAINGLSVSGMQPFSRGADVTNVAAVVCNGEVYNYRALAAEHGFEAALTSGSDCEALLPLFAALGGDAVEFARSLDGVFALVLADAATDRLLVARDPYGVRPLFVATAKDGGGAAARLAFASELKALVAAGVTDDALYDVAPFPPGHAATYCCKTGALLSLQPFHAVPWLKQPALVDAVTARAAVRAALEDAVRKRLLSDRPIGALLSGGLDSSLVAALAARALRAAPGSPKLRTFAVGMNAAPGTDLHYARLVAAHIGSEHHGASAVRPRLQPPASTPQPCLCARRAQRCC